MSQVRRLLTLGAVVLPYLHIGVASGDLRRLPHPTPMADGPSSLKMEPPMWWCGGRSSLPLATPICRYGCQTADMIYVLICDNPN